MTPNFGISQLSNAYPTKASDKNASHQLGGNLEGFSEGRASSVELCIGHRFVLLTLRFELTLQVTKPLSQAIA